jgi:hypothetical protein
MRMPISIVHQQKAPPFVVLPHSVADNSGTSPTRLTAQETLLILPSNRKGEIHLLL